MVAIYKSDDTSAFGNNFITIKANIPTGYLVSKAEFKVGILPKFTFLNPSFPLVVNLTAEQTKKLQSQNECYLAVYDANGKKKTCKGSLKFIAKEEVV